MIERPDRDVPNAAPDEMSGVPDGRSRREFLQATAAIAGASLLSSCLSSGDDVAPLPGDSSAFLANIDHLVVVMFENRSFDNLLGYLYAQGKTPTPNVRGPTPRNWPSGWPLPPAVPMVNGSAQAFEGLWQFPGVAPADPASCTGIGGCNPDGGSLQFVAYPHNLPACASGVDSPPFRWDYPNPNPDEGLEAYYGKDGKPGQMGKVVSAPGQPIQWDMSGFASQYSRKATAAGTDPRTIMGSYTSAQLPVLSTLARNFAVFDHWFSANPAETYGNRAFFHASTSWGYAENENDWTSPPGFVSKNSIFDVLERSNITWGVYLSGAEQTAATATDTFKNVGLTGLVHFEAGKSFGPPTYQDAPADPGRQRFWPFENFFADVDNDALRQYTFIEPIYGKFPFPPASGPDPDSGNDFHPPQDVRYGEEILRRIYEKIRTSKQRDRTMLLVVFDEHGGTFDHVSPPSPVPAPWDKDPPPMQFDFKFTTLGMRVPAIAISSWTLPGTIVNTPVHHAAVINTLFRKFVDPNLMPGQRNYLTERDRGGSGGDLGGAYNGARSSDNPWPPLDQLTSSGRVDPPNVPTFPPCTT